MQTCAKCGEKIDGVFVVTVGGGVMHRHCYEQDNPPMSAQTLYQVARGRGDPVLAAEVIAAMVPEEMADQIVTEFNRRMMAKWQRRCVP